MLRRDQIEPARIYVELTAALFTATLPLAVMTATFALVGLFVAILDRDMVADSALAVGLVASAYKGWLHWAYRRAHAAGPPDAAGSLIWEQRFAVGNLALAATVGTLTARAFVLDDVGAELLGTGMMFGFCSGQVARIAVRPRLCSLSICVAAVPAVIAALAHGGVVHLGLATMFLLFMSGGIESVRYAYEQTRQRIASNQELAGIASIDPLTALNNRLGLRRAIEDHVRTDDGGLIGVHCFDLDGFKAVNDHHGHAGGDALLVELARRVTEVLRDGDVAARIGGDEFVIVQAGLVHPDEAEMFARRILRIVTGSYEIAGLRITIGMSIGSSTGRADTADIDDLIGLADDRMYQAKRAGGGLYVAASAR